MTYFFKTKDSLFQQWLINASSWIFLALESPTIVALMARFPEQKKVLAAYGVTISVVLLIEAPLNMLQAVAVTLVKNKQSFRIGSIVTLFFTALAAFLVFICSFSSIVSFVSSLFNVPPELFESIRKGFIFLIFWPAMIGIRRFIQGCMLKVHCNKPILIATIIRYIVMIITVFLCYQHNMDGLTAGMLGHIIGVSVETLYTLCYVPSIWKQLPLLPENAPKLTYKKFISYFVPLACTMIVIVATQPLAVLCAGWAPYSYESFAVLPAIGALTFVLRAPGFALQEVALVWLSNKNPIIPGKQSTQNISFIKKEMEYLHRFVRTLTLLIAIFCIIFYITPLALAWYSEVSGLSPSLARYAWAPAFIFAIFAPTETIVSYFRAFFIHIGKPKFVLFGGIIELLSAIGFLFFFLFLFPHWNGALVSAVAVVLARFAALGVQSFWNHSTSH